MRILLVEDDEVIGQSICDFLTQNNNDVEWLKDGESAEHALFDQKFSAVILDVGLPKRSGLEVLKTVRTKGMNVPILLLSTQGSDDAVMQGLDLGADDYLSKPFSLQVLAARVRAIQRRHSPRSVSTAEFGDVRLDPRSHSVYINDDRISISQREYTLLEKLLLSAGEVVTREMLSESIYGVNVEVESNAVEVHVHNLRKKIKVDLIKTIRGVGYIVDAPLLS